MSKPLIQGVPPGFGVVPRIHKVKGDARGLVGVQLDHEPPVNLLDGVAAQPGLPGILLLHLVDQGHLDVDFLPHPLDAEVDVIRQGQHHIGVQLVVQLVAGDVHQLDGEMQHLLGQFIEQGQIPLVHIIKPPVDQGQVGQLIGGLGEPDPLAVGDEGDPFLILAEHKIVIQLFDHLHRLHRRTAPPVPSKKPLKA